MSVGWKQPWRPIPPSLSSQITLSLAPRHHSGFCGHIGRSCPSCRQLSFSLLLLLLLLLLLRRWTLFQDGWRKSVEGVGRWTDRSGADLIDEMAVVDCAVVDRMIFTEDPPDVPDSRPSLWRIWAAGRWRRRPRRRAPSGRRPAAADRGVAAPEPALSSTDRRSRCSRDPPASFWWWSTSFRRRFRPPAPSWSDAPDCGGGGGGRRRRLSGGAARPRSGAVGPETRRRDAAGARPVGRPRAGTWPASRRPRPRPAPPDVAGRRSRSSAGSEPPDGRRPSWRRPAGSVTPEALPPPTCNDPEVP